jgi:hypothetical protein
MRIYVVMMRVEYADGAYPVEAFIDKEKAEASAKTQHSNEAGSYFEVQDCILHQ